jgi:hypothetical protein
MCTREYTAHNNAVYCLIISCSQRKHSTEEPVSALELYDGFYYQIIKKLLREGHFPANINVVIISAKHGLLRPSDPILPYDQKMTARRATEIRDQLLAKLDFAFSEKQYQEVFVNLGRHYLRAIDGFDSLLPDETKVIYAIGSIGKRGSQMKKWILSKGEVDSEDA